MSSKKWLFTDNGARWKKNTKFENMLSYKADKSNFWKYVYVGYYRLIDGKFYKKGLNLINKQIDIFYEKHQYLPFSRKELIVDMVYSLHRFGAMFDEYFLFKFYEKNATGRDAFICDKYRFEYYKMLNLTENRHLFDNKNETYTLFYKYYGRELLFCQGEEDFSKFLAFVTKHSSFIIKPFDSSGGRGIRKETLTVDAAKHFFETELSKGKFIVEEVIQQSAYMKVLHPESVNTVRVFTVVCKEEVKLFACFLRVGRGNAVIDNAFAGGIVCAVDAKTGIVYSVGKTEKQEAFLYHPDTNVPIVGFQLPDWEDAISLCKALSGVVKGNRCIGWDIAHTENGWVMVEGNCRGQIGVQQISDGIGKKQMLLDMIHDV